MRKVFQFKGGNASRPVALHLSEAVGVDGVSTGQHRSRPYAVKEVLEAHWTILPHAVLHADVIVLQRRKLGCQSGAAPRKERAVLHLKSQLTQLHTDLCTVQEHVSAG